MRIELMYRALQTDPNERESAGQRPIHIMLGADWPRREGVGHVVADNEGQDRTRIRALRRCAIHEDLPDRPSVDDPLLDPQELEQLVGIGLLQRTRPFPCFRPGLTRFPRLGSVPKPEERSPHTTSLAPAPASRRSRRECGCMLDPAAPRYQPALATRVKDDLYDVLATLQLLRLRTETSNVGVPTRWSHFTLDAGPLRIAQDDAERAAARDHDQTRPAPNATARRSDVATTARRARPPHSYGDRQPCSRLLTPPSREWPAPASTVRESARDLFRRVCPPASVHGPTLCIRELRRPTLSAAQWLPPPQENGDRGTSSAIDARVVARPPLPTIGVG